VSLAPKEQISDAEQTRWFAEEVHPHSGHLRAYIRSVFPSLQDVDDVVQESYLRIWKARLTRPIHSSKAFLFQIARHLAIDVIRSRRINSTEYSEGFAALSVLESGPDAATSLTKKEKIELLSEALASLPPRIREVIFMRKFQQIPQRDVAATLGVSERTIEANLAKGMRLCERFLRKRGIKGFPYDE